MNIYTAKCSKEKKEALIICLLKYLNYNFPSWRSNQYYLKHFNGFPIGSKLYVLVSSLLSRRFYSYIKSQIT